MLQTDMLCGDIHTPHSIFCLLRKGQQGQPPPKGPDAREAKAQEAADMKKKVTDLSQALAVGLPVPASAAGETFSDVPALGRPRSSGVEERGEAAPSDPYSFHPFESAYSTRLPPGIVFHSYCPQRTQVRPWASARP